MMFLPSPSGTIFQKNGTGKKGLGSWGEIVPAEKLEQLHLSWYYNWTPFPKKTAAPGLEFVPMFWSGEFVTARNIELVQKSDARAVLGFNEPDHGGQSMMTVDECLDLWPQLMVLKQRLGSPGPAGYQWLEKFMPEAKARGLRVDFVCIHLYPDFTDPGAVDGVEKILNDVHQKYGLPIWLTEFGAVDVKAWHQPRHRAPTPEKARLFVKKLLPMLERLPFLERYAWYIDVATNEYSPGSIFSPQRQKLTPLGMIFRDAP